ncbi:MAG: hypothetical protein EPO22_09555, partial [Dehalococcoidia bacterium]
MHLRLWLMVPLVLVVLFSPGTETIGEGADAMFGNGSDGAITFSSNTQFDPPVDAVVVAGTAGTSTLTVSSVSGLFQPGEKILIHQTRGSGSGAWELNAVQSYAVGNLATSAPLANAYLSDAGAGVNKAQVLVVPQYTNVTVNAGISLSAKPWNGATGGILAFLASGTVTITGTIQASGVSSSDPSGGTGATGGAGFDGGSNVVQGQATQGEGTGGPRGTASQVANGNGAGGGAYGSGIQIASGSGGGNGGVGGQGYAYFPSLASAPGAASGTSDLTTMSLGGGGGGGSGSADGMSYGGGSGAGMVVIVGTTIAMTGGIAANGGDNGGAPTICPNSSKALGGGGGGGSILVRTQNATLGTGTIIAVGGSGASRCGDAGSASGAVGRIRVEYCTSISGGFADPPASIAQISCGPTPTPTPPPSVGGIAEQPDVTAVPAAAASSG